jgi:2-keto-4-pentenoate hydratase
LQQLTDGFNNGAFVLGPACADWRDIDYARCDVVLRGAADGRALASGSGAAVLDGDPVGAVVAMANLRPPPPGGLRTGQVITTGTCTPPLAVSADGEFIGDFGPLGTVSVRFGGAGASGPDKESP